MKQQLKKPVIASIGCASILLSTFALSHETIISATTLEPPIKNVLTKEKVAIDPAITTITEKILTPVRLQEQRRNVFSRSMPTRSNSYNLVEVSSDQAKGARYFDIQITTNDLRHLFAIEITKITKKDTQAKPEPKTYLKLKYLTASNNVLIQQDQEWVEPAKHKYFSLFPTIKK